VEVLRAEEEEEAVIARPRSSVRRPPRRALALAGALALGAVAPDARADDDPQTVAEELLERGRALLAKSSTLDEACRTLAESYRVMARGDTMLNLAECHRRQGKTASAWAEFDKAISYGSEAGFPEAIKTAMVFRAQLWEKISRITVTVSPRVAALPGFAVEVGDAAWPRERWNTPFIIDPGPLRVKAHATGYKPFEAQLQIGANKDAKSVVVELEIEPPPAPPPLPPPPPLAPVAKPQHPVWPWFVGGAGLLLGAGAVAAEIVSLAAHKELDDKCGTARLVCQYGYDFHPARTREVVGFGLFLGLGAGAVLSVGAAGVGLGLSYRSRAPGASLLVTPTSIGVGSVF
jgi:hypothetical protein